MSVPSRRHRVLAHVLRSSRLVDRTYRRFDRLRSGLVLRYGSDAFFDAFNDVTFGSQAAYDPSSLSFRAELHPEEAEAVARFFPHAPARLLIGGAGGGREAMVLARRGYRVTAFDPAVKLVRASAAWARTERVPVEFLVGRYGDLPQLRSPVAGAVVDLTGRRFDAAIFGWTSYSNLKHDGERVEAMRRMAAATSGPLLVTYFPRPESAVDGGRRGRFAMSVGFFQELSGREVGAFAARAGLVVRHSEDRANWPWIILAHP